MEKWLQYIFSNWEQSAIWLQFFVITFVTLVAAFFVNRFLKRVILRLKKTRTPWDEALAVALRRPIRALIWLVGLAFALSTLGNELDAAIFNAVGPMRDVGVVAVLVWFMLSFIKESEKLFVEYKSRKGEKIDITTVDAVGKLLRITVMITGALIMLQTLGYSISGVLAFGGISGVAVGFAAKDLLANFFGAMMIYFDRPFAVGDWIRSPDRDIEGTVEHIGWRQTRIITFDKRPLYVPNAAFSTISVQNPSRMSNRRIYEHIGVRYDDMAKVEKIVKDVEKMLKNHKEIDTEQTLMVHLDRFNESSVDFFIYSFTKTTEWIKYHAIKQDVLLKIAGIIEKHGADIAFPTTTLHVASVSPEMAGVKA